MKKQEKILTPEHLTSILDSINDGVFTVNKEWRITSFNQAAECITGVPREEALGRSCCDVFRASICESECALRETMTTGKPVINKALYIVNADGDQIPISVSTALLKDRNGAVIGGVETFRDLSLVEELRKELSRHYTFEEIISKSHKMQRLFDILPDVAVSESTVLIEGESGTGKELFARAIHTLSARKEAPFVAVNCGALPDTLLESELFGYKAGAFTDAKKDKPGRFAQAQKGTIFLDEIGDVSPALQVRLLRVLQEKTFEPLGATESFTTNARVVTATNKSLEILVKKGSFRKDLYYRINIVKLTIPPLRERKEDIPLLIAHFINRFNRIKEKDINDVSTQTLSILVRHEFPGNVRELENIIEHAFILCSGGLIEPQHLPDYLISHAHEPSVHLNTKMTLKQMEKHLLLEVLKRNNWNRKAAAKELGIHKSTLFRKIRLFAIQLPEIDGRSSKK